MKKILFIFVIFCLNCSFAQEAVRAGIKYNEASAKIEAFKNVQRKIEKTFYKDYLKDKDYKENLDLIEKKIYIVKNKRTICPFYFKKTLLAYAIVYVDMPNRVFYYNILGNLVKFDITENNDFPRKTFGYSRYGNLINVAFEADKDEQFIYDKNGKLIAHWSGNIMIDEKTKFFKITRMQNE